MLQLLWFYIRIHFEFAEFARPFPLWPGNEASVHSAHVPHSQVLLSHDIHSSGAGLGGTSAHGEPPPTILLMIFMTIQKPSNWGSKWRLDWFSFLNSVQIWAVAHHTPSVCMFSWRPECQMSVWGHWSSLWISLNPICQGGYAPFHPCNQERGGMYPPRLHLVGVCTEIWQKFLGTNSWS